MGGGSLKPTGESRQGAGCLPHISCKCIVPMFLPTQRAILEWDREKKRHTKKSQQGKEVKTVARTEDIKITALYERLSRDDEQVGESNSIQNHDVMYRGWNTPKNITS